MTKNLNHFSMLIVGIYMGISLVKFVIHIFSGYMTNILINQQLFTQKKLYQNGLFIKWFFMADTSVPSDLWLLWADNTGEYFPLNVRWTFQSSAYAYHEVEQSSVLIATIAIARFFHCFVHAYRVSTTFVIIVCGHEITRVLCGPPWIAGCSRRDH